ncbi:MAG: MotA/TolQ/ExbB proton channel family protein [Pseudobacteriovorax sp.]|nr:MotA/TolQ/ExbB proton channel family protein [Pseudobacteriovorax sp.]
MDLATVVGAAMGVATIIAVMLMSGSLIMYWDLLSLIVVVGGAVFSVMMRWPIKAGGEAVKHAMTTVFNPMQDPAELIEIIIDLAGKARKESILALEKEEIENPLLAKGIRLAVDGTEPDMIDQMIADDLRIAKKRMNDGRGIFDDMAEASPAFGMIGTVIGLIVIMANLADPIKIGPGLAVALVTTLYGSLFSNMFFVPIGKKLKYRTGEFMTNGEIIKTGVLGILSGTNPNLIRERLNSHLENAPEAKSDD